MTALWLLAACLPDLGPRSVAAHAGRCGDCHPAHAQQLAASAHREPASSELFVALRDHAAASGLAPALCERCHLPEGLTCGTCHAAATHHRPFNGELVHDWTGPVRGPSSTSRAPHASVADPFVTSSALCGTCHDVTGLAGFEERPYEHWLRSPAAADGVRCQDCHMPDHQMPGWRADPQALLRTALTLQRVPEGVALTNHAGHHLPDGASSLRELWVEARGAQLQRWELHAELRTGGQPTWDPVQADEVVLRGIEAGATRTFALPVGTTEVCVCAREVNLDVSAALGLPQAEAWDVACLLW
ncbi:MAG: hypothetical protein KTR31_16125 [Myxococcales bacterium]|nr:hypothetical protein [Myxococcales bacterium]